MTTSHHIIGVHIRDRFSHVPPIQNVFTTYGCFIKSRIGLHEVTDGTCSPNGLILIEFIGDTSKRDEFCSTLQKIEGVEVKTMVFDHD